MAGKTQTFRKPPQQSNIIDPAVADAFVKQGTVNPPATAPKPSTASPEGKTTRLAFDLPVELHARFKAACAMHKTKMGEEIRNFVEEWTQSHG